MKVHAHGPALPCPVRWTPSRTALSGARAEEVSAPCCWSRGGLRRLGCPAWQAAVHCGACETHIRLLPAAS